MDIDDTRSDLIEHVTDWCGVADQLWVRMTDGTESWIDIRSNLASQLYAHPELGSKLSEVRATAASLAKAKDQHLAAVRAAFNAGTDRTDLAAAAGLTRDGLYKLLKRNAG